MERGTTEFPSRRKIVPAGDGGLGLALASRRATGRTIGLTNGCYDLFHVGHLAMLQHAASYCDDLIVAIDSEVLVRHAHGAGRPFFGFDERAVIVAALECVWRVIPIDMTAQGESCLPAILEALRPNVYICRWVEPVPEIPAAEAAGARIIRLLRHGDWSSARIASILRHG